MRFEEFAAGLLPGLLRYAMVLTADRELAQDVVQDAMLKAHRNWDRVVADLPKRQRAVIALRYYEDLPDPEIAALLGCSQTSALVYASRALKALRIELTHAEPTRSATPATTRGGHDDDRR